VQYDVRDTVDMEVCVGCGKKRSKLNDLCLLTWPARELIFTTELLARCP
jgi:hypothetical protein